MPSWVTREVVSRFGLSAPERAVLLCLWDHANKYLVSWPSHSTISRETGFSESTTKGATKTLHRRGFIRREDGRGPFDAAPHDRKAVRWVMEASYLFIDQALVQEVH
ncbi:helix-turn-helix domain-containing protein [Microbacterium sp. ISL-103]|uniref:helix-turn-helix domain-containing protein n=1 Tax=Microbacterium sp. ISL-103 TaxID=2819156 RepID=UPI001BE975A3|nr:helix-turn-helix domain-containing protein [Microbacterium sp. ISL-103]